MPLSYSEAVAISLGVGTILGLGVRLLLGGRSHLGFAASALSGIVGAFLGAEAASFIDGDDRIFRRFVLELPAAALGTLVVLLVATKVTKRPEPTVAGMVAGGESHRVEFKSTARFNRHTGTRDEKLELVVAKTIAAMANSDGGDLLIGVADDGSVLGLAGDLPLMKQPDTDRYELWLRDFLTTTLGAAATSVLQVRFPVVSDLEICQVTVPRSKRPVFVTPGRNQGPQLWVRVGNSTRQLPLDQALTYASDRFGRRLLRRRRTS